MEQRTGVRLGWHYSAAVINACEPDKRQLIQWDSLLHSLDSMQTSSIVAEACLQLCFRF